MAQQGNPAGACCPDQHYPIFSVAPHLYLYCLIWARITASLSQQTVQGNDSMENFVQCSLDHDCDVSTDNLLIDCGAISWHTYNEIHVLLIWIDVHPLQCSCARLYQVYVCALALKWYVKIEPFGHKFEIMALLCYKSGYVHCWTYINKMESNECWWKSTCNINIIFIFVQWSVQKCGTCSSSLSRPNEMNSPLSSSNARCGFW